MEQKKEIKISLNKASIIILIICVLPYIIGCIISFINNNLCVEENITEYNGKYKKITSIVCKNYIVDDEKKYSIISSKSTLYNSIISPIRNEIIETYNNAVERNIDKSVQYYYSTYGFENLPFDVYSSSGFEDIDWNKNSILVIQCKADVAPTFKTKLMSISEENSIVKVKIYCDRHGSLQSTTSDIYFIPISKEISSANIEYEYKEYNDFWLTSDKPVIYLYPTEEKEVLVNLKYEDMITVSYPKYNDGWDVIAKDDGTIIDLKTEKNLYCLYYECKNLVNFNVEKDGFCIKGTEVSTFLEDKLAKLGLTERESEEFIIYWLSKLESNKYNYIRFATTNEINANMPLNINPKPDTLIRVLMTYKGLNNPISVEEQELITPERTGFVAVEWGGTELK